MYATFLEEISPFAACLMLVVGSIVIAEILIIQRKKRKSINSGKWRINTGKQPALFNVDVVYENGSSSWGVPAKELSWQRGGAKSIKKFRVARPL